MVLSANIKFSTPLYQRLLIPHISRLMYGTTSYTFTFSILSMLPEPDGVFYELSGRNNSPVELRQQISQINNITNVDNDLHFGIGML